MEELGEVEEFIADNELLDPERPDDMFEPIGKRGLAQSWARGRAMIAARLERGDRAARANADSATGFRARAGAPCSLGTFGAADFAFAKFFLGAHAVGLERARGKRVPRGGGAEMAVTDIVEVGALGLVALFGGAGLVEMWTGSTRGLL